MMESKACLVQIMLFVGLLTYPIISATMCTAAADVCIILDESGSISSADFSLMLDFVSTIISNITVSESSSRVALITFSSSSRVKFHLNTYTNRDDVITAVQSHSQRVGSTYTGKALNLLDTSVFTAANGDRPNIPNIAILVTDGYSTDPTNTRNKAVQTQAHGNFIFAIGVSGARDSELQIIANDPDELYKFDIAQFDYLTDVASQILPKACAIAQTGGNIVGIACTNDTFCSSRIANTACDGQFTCQCSPGYYVYDVETLLCRYRHVGDACSSDSDCAFDANSTCISNTCDCSSPYSSYEDSCYLCDLARSCPRNLNCSGVIANSECIDGVLGCSAGWVGVTGNSTACRPMLLLEDACTKTSQCTTGASCVGGVCACGIAYTTSPDGTTCVPKPLGSRCSTTAECEGISGAECGMAGTCACGQAYIVDGSACRARGIGELCTVTPDCTGITGVSVCQAVGVGWSICQCDPGYISADTVTCRVRGVGEACSSNTECGLSLSYCKDGQCVCEPGASAEDGICVQVGASQSGGPDVGAIVGGVLGCLGVLGAAGATGAVIVHMSANTAYLAKALDAMCAQTQATSQCVENVFPGMTPACCSATYSAAPTSTRFCG